MIDIPQHLAQCAPQVSPVLMHALVRTESSWNPLAIGPDVGQPAIAQPGTLDEAVRTVKQLQASGAKFSLGLAQIHVSNVTRRGLTLEQAFDPCRNLRMGQTILFENYNQAIKEGYTGVDAVWAALRGYNSGGVNKPVSDKYANKIFTYMQRVAGAGQTGKTTPASTDPRFSQFTQNVEVSALGAYAPFTLPMLTNSKSTNGAQAAPGSNPGTMREGESPDIFQSQGGKQGF